jgi:hypothetical protein
MPHAQHPALCLWKIFTLRQKWITRGPINMSLNCSAYMRARARTPPAGSFPPPSPRTIHTHPTHVSLLAAGNASRNITRRIASLAAWDLFADASRVTSFPNVSARGSIAFPLSRRGSNEFSDTFYWDDNWNSLKSPVDLFTFQHSRQLLVLENDW